MSLTSLTNCALYSRHFTGAACVFQVQESGQRFALLDKFPMKIPEMCHFHSLRFFSPSAKSLWVDELKWNNNNDGFSAVVWSLLAPYAVENNKKEPFDFGANNCNSFLHARRTIITRIIAADTHESGVVKSSSLFSPRRFFHVTLHCKSNICSQLAARQYLHLLYCSCYG